MPSCWIRTDFLFGAVLEECLKSEFAPQYPEQRNDHSCGFYSVDVLRYFNPPTLGVANGTSPIEGVVPAPHFNVTRGWFDVPFTLLLDVALSGASIRYTTDGSEPSESNGEIYIGPIVVAKTGVIRAAAFRTDYLPSQVKNAHLPLFRSGHRAAQ